MNPKHELKYFDAFCGLGGFSLAARHCFLNPKCVKAVDFDKDAAETFKNNFSLEALGDMRDLDPKNVEDFDILFGGFPCQPFSRNGKWYNKNNRIVGIEEERDNLFLTLVNLLQVKKPKFFILENVPGLINMKNDDGTLYFETIKNSLKSLGYKVKTKILDSADYGSPQQRKRLFFVGCPEDYEWSWPEKIPRASCVKDILDDQVSDKYKLINLWKKRKINDSPPVEGRPKKSKNHSIDKGGSRLLALAEIYHGWDKPKTITGKITPIAVLYGDTPSGLPRQQDKLYSIRGISPTIATFSTPGFDAPGGWRQLSPRECARLQGISDLYKLPQSDSKAYKQIGNAVNVLTVSRLLNSLLIEPKQRIKNEID